VSAVAGSSALALARGEEDPIRREAEESLAALTPAERVFVDAYLASGRAGDSAEAAGLSKSDAAKARRRPSVQRAIRARIRLREAEANVSHEEACRLLEAALLVRASDLLVFDEDGETPIGLRARETLTAAEELRIVEFESKHHGNAAAPGESGAKVRRLRQRYVKLRLIPATEILDRLAKLRGWTPESPSFQILLHQVSALPAERGAGAGPSFALAHDLAAELLQGERLDAYLIAHASGDAGTMATLLREGAAELRAAAGARPVAAIPAAVADRAIEDLLR